MVNWFMKKITLELPDDLVKELKIRAVHEGKKLKGAVADVLRAGLAAPSIGSPTVIRAGKAMLKRRKAIAEKFVTGQWGLELKGFEAARAADRKSASERARRWKK